MRRSEGGHVVVLLSAGYDIFQRYTGICDAWLDWGSTVGIGEPLHHSEEIVWHRVVAYDRIVAHQRRGGVGCVLPRVGSGADVTVRVQRRRIQLEVRRG